MVNIQKAEKTKNWIALKKLFSLLPSHNIAFYLTYYHYHLILCHLPYLVSSLLSSLPCHLCSVRPLLCSTVIFLSIVLPFLLPPALLFALPFALPLTWLLPYLLSSFYFACCPFSLPAVVSCVLPPDCVLFCPWSFPKLNNYLTHCLASYFALYLA